MNSKQRLCIVHGQMPAEALKQVIDSKEWIVQIVLGVIPISEKQLLPKADALPFAPPQQSYLRFGPVSFDYKDDICKDRALLVIEHDTDYCRVDQIESCASLTEQIAQAKNDTSVGFLNCHQLADSFMRHIAFKLGKVDKFGA